MFHSAVKFFHLTRDSANCVNYFVLLQTFVLDLRTHKQSMTFPSTLLVLYDQ